MTDRSRATLGVLLGIFLAAVDGTVVSTAMPTVVGSLGVCLLAAVAAWAVPAPGAVGPSPFEEGEKPRSSEDVGAAGD